MEACALGHSRLCVTSLQMFAWIANTSQNLSEMTLQVPAAGKEHNMHELGLLTLLKVLEAMKMELLGL